MFRDILFAVMSVVMGGGGITISYILFNELKNPFSGPGAPITLMMGLLVGLSIGLIIGGVQDAWRSIVRRKQDEMET